ncbi:50S ribosomal protein L5 [Candidatus Peregrinibacteria bacterium]|nr:50S ribosomal protein L5 [Candidatus Peregrinibacteria bacterium]
MKKTILQTYREEIVPALCKTLGLKNVNAAPKLKAIVVNVGVGSAVAAGKDHEEVVKNVQAITGQKPIVTRSKKAISNFKLKINMPSGVVVTLRGKRMYEFLNKLVNVTFPRIRDFRGVSRKSFDGHGNYSIGIREHIVFPEIQTDDVSKTHGVQITIKTSAKNDNEALELLKAFGFPFKAPLVPTSTSKKS